ncbi:hypothetical protein C8R46DRAFT_1070748 [Mycena filopes]|nr:hypothetical protein C8R46DRAFT_1070748 [Mycena filopes]
MRHRARKEPSQELEALADGMLQQLFFCRRCSAVLADQLFERVRYGCGRPQSVIPDHCLEVPTPRGEAAEECVYGDGGDNGFERDARVGQDFICSAGKEDVVLVAVPDKVRRKPGSTALEEFRSVDDADVGLVSGMKKVASPRFEQRVRDAAGQGYEVRGLPVCALFPLGYMDRCPLLELRPSATGVVGKWYPDERNPLLVSAP